MKRILLGLLVLITSAAAMQAQSLGDILGGLGSKASSSDTTSTGSQSGLGGALGSVLGTLTASNKFSPESMVGTWNYSSPAVGFASDNVLKKVGGAAAASALEQKLQPYYQKAGLESVSLTVNDDLSFTMKIKAISLNGTISKDADNNLVFNFQAFKKIKLGSLKTIATKSGDTLTVVFDATGLMKVLNAISSVAKLQSLSTLNSLLQSYDGLYIGFKMKKS